MSTARNASKVLCITLQQSFGVQNDAPLPSTIVLTVLHAISGLFSVLINSAIIIAFLRREQLKTAGNLILTSMAISDLLVGLIVQPLTVGYQIHSIHGNDSCVLQNISSLVAILCVSMSFVNACMFAMDRCFAVMMPFKYLEEKIYKKYMACIIASWLAISLLVILTYANIFNGKVLQELMTLLFIVAMMLTTLSYFIIYCAIRAQKKRIGSQAPQSNPRETLHTANFKGTTRHSFKEAEIGFPKSFVSPEADAVVGIDYRSLNSAANANGDDCFVSDQPNSTEAMKCRDFKKQRARTYTVIVILVIFMLCYLPLTVLNIITKNVEIGDTARIIAYDWANFLIVFNSSLNPIIYCIRVKTIRNEVKATFRCIIPYRFRA